MTKRKSSERGQALAETALFSVLAIVFVFGFLALIPFHRARTVAAGKFRRAHRQGPEEMRGDQASRAHSR